MAIHLDQKQSQLPNNTVWRRAPDLLFVAFCVIHSPTLLLLLPLLLLFFLLLLELLYHPLSPIVGDGISRRMEGQPQLLYTILDNLLLVRDQVAYRHAMMLDWGGCRPQQASRRLHLSQPLSFAADRVRPTRTSASPVCILSQLDSMVQTKRRCDCSEISRAFRHESGLNYLAWIERITGDANAGESFKASW